jgi:hypothetical protein
MKNPSTRFKSRKVGLKEPEQSFRYGKHFQTGRPFKRLGDLRSREILANWLICVAVNYAMKSEFLALATRSAAMELSSIPQQEKRGRPSMLWRKSRARVQRKMRTHQPPT